METRVYIVLPWAFLLTVLPSVLPESQPVLNEETGELLHDFVMEGNFKILIPARSAECFYNKYQENSTAYISYEVVDGGDRKIDVHMKDLKANIHMFPEAVDVISDFKEYKFPKETVAEFCFKNFKSSFQRKLLALGIYRTFYRPMTFQDKSEQESYKKADNFSSRFQKITETITNITMSASHSSILYMHDFLRMKSNRDYVQYWAIFHVVLILGTAFLQVYFLRQFFRDPSDGKRPRV